MIILANVVYALALLAFGVVFAFFIDHAIAGRERTGQLSVRNARQFFRQFFRPDPGHKWKDRVLFYAAAPTALAAITVALSTIPVGAWFQNQPMPQLGVGIFFYLVILDFMAVALYMAGWGANHPWGSHGAFLAAAQLVSYLVPLGFAVTGAVMAAQSLRPAEVINVQGRELWFGVWQPLGLAIYLLAALGQTYRPPADLPIRGEGMDVMVEYRGASAAALKVALYGIWFAAASMGTLLFLGGWHGPWLPGPLWFLIKTAGLLAVMSWLGTLMQPLSLEQMVRRAWTILVPASIVNVVIVGLIIVLWKK